MKVHYLLPKNMGNHIKLMSPSDSPYNIQLKTVALGNYKVIGKNQI